MGEKEELEYLNNLSLEELMSCAEQGARMVIHNGKITGYEKRTTTPMAVQM